MSVRGAGEIGPAVEHVAAHCLVGQIPEPALDHVQPGALGGGAVQLDAGARPAGWRHARVCGYQLFRITCSSTSGANSPQTQSHERRVRLAGFGEASGRVLPARAPSRVCGRWRDLPSTALSDTGHTLTEEDSPSQRESRREAHLADWVERGGSTACATSIIPAPSRMTCPRRTVRAQWLDRGGPGVVHPDGPMPSHPPAAVPLHRSVLMGRFSCPNNRRLTSSPHTGSRPRSVGWRRTRCDSAHPACTAATCREERKRSFEATASPGVSSPGKVQLGDNGTASEEPAGLGGASKADSQRPVPNAASSTFER